MKVHKCPAHIFRMFDDTDEATKAEGRKQTIDWLRNQNPQEGDVAIIPNPDTGEEVFMVKGPVEQ